MICCVFFGGGKFFLGRLFWVIKQWSDQGGKPSNLILHMPNMTTITTIATMNSW